jgi:hypothetical protein
MGEIKLADKFPDANKALRNLLDPDIHNQLDRLNEIYNHVEKSWERNIKRLNGKNVQYLLIAEAAPWTPNGMPIRYFYSSPDGAWSRRILKTFIDPSGSDNKNALSKLADEGFLLLDTLPFALKYSTNIRQGDDYFTLLKASKKHFIEKLNQISLDEKVKVAIAFKWNGKKVIEAYDGKIELKNGPEIKLSEDQIAIDGSNYTSTQRLREIFDLNQK